MDVRFIGAGVAVGSGLCALGVLGIVLFTQNSTPIDRQSDALLVARSDGADEFIPVANPSRLPLRTPIKAVPSETPLSNGMPDNRSVTAPAATNLPIAVAPSSATVTLQTKLVAPPASDQPAVSTKPPVAKQGPVATPKTTPRAVVDHRYDHVFTTEEIRKLKTAMRLSPDQERLWGPVAGLLRDIGRQQTAKIDAGQKPEFDMGFDAMQRFYTAASPFLQSLREDQKVEIRRRANEMGLGTYASYI